MAEITDNRKQYDARTGERIADSSNCHIAHKSKRFGNGLSILDESCKFCGHNKIFMKHGKRANCCRCGKVAREQEKRK